MKLVEIIPYHVEAFGGLRKARANSKNTIWNHPSFRGYADYMESSDFKDAIMHLESLASIKKCAIMCSEAVWWRCHRSMISDKLKADVWEVIHIMGEHQHQEHPYTKHGKWAIVLSLEKKKGEMTKQNILWIGASKERNII